MAEQSTALKAPSATARLKVDVWVHFGFKKDGKKRRVGQTTGNMQTMQRDGEMLREYDQSLDHLTRHHQAETQSTRLKQTSLEQVLAPQLPASSQRAQKKTGCCSFYMQRHSTEVALKLSSHAMFCRLAKQLSEVTAPNMYACLKQSVDTSLQTADNVALLSEVIQSGFDL